RDGNATEAVLVMEALAVAAAIAGGHLGRVMHGGDYVLPVGIEMALQREFAAARPLAAAPGAVDQQARQGFFLHADFDGPRVVLKNLLKIGGPVAAAGIDAVEALGVFARIVVKLQLVVFAHF